MLFFPFYFFLFHRLDKKNEQKDALPLRGIVFEKGKSNRST